MVERPLSYAVAFVWAALAYFLLRNLQVVSVLLRPRAAADIIQLGAVEALAFTSCTYALLRVHAAGRPMRAALGLRPTPPALSVLGLALGLALQLPAASLGQLMERLAPTPEADLRVRATLLGADTPGQLVAILVVTACVAPLVEELFARGAMYGALVRHYPVVGAAGVSALCFVALHGDWRNWLPLLLVAGVLSHLRAASGSVLPGLALHVAFNTSTVLAVFTGAGSVTRPLHLGWPAVGAGWAATAGLVFAVQWAATRSPAAAVARREDVR
jgi:membrane protease YdiL (CAAX protease family)